MTRSSGEIIELKTVINALHKARGVITHAAELVPCHWSYIYKLQKSEPQIDEAIKEARELKKIERIERQERILDEAYNSTEDLIKKRDCTMTIFIMKTVGGLEEKDKRNLALNVLVNRKPYGDNRVTAPVPVPELSDSSVGSA